MAELTNFVYCLNANRAKSPDGKGENITAIGVLATLMPEYIPGAFSFSIIFTILDIDVKTENEIRIKFFENSSGEVIVDSGAMKIPPITNENDTLLPKEYQGLNLSMDLRNVVLKNDGLYSTEMIVNGEKIATKPIYVKGKHKHE